MRLSEAIRLGAMLRPQAFGRYFTQEQDGSVRSCALGAAYEAITGRTTVVFPAAFPILEETYLRFGPCKCGWFVNLGIAIMHLNDKHRWTREQIAAWVETIEPQEQPQSANAVEQQSSETALKSAYI